MPHSTIRSERHTFWEAHVHAWQDSGISKAMYCREHELQYHQFIYWVSKIGSSTSRTMCTSEPPRFLPVAIKHPTVAAELQVRLANGATISGINAETVELAAALMAAR